MPDHPTSLSLKDCTWHRPWRLPAQRDQAIEGDESTMPEEILLFDTADDPFAIFASVPIEKKQTGLVNIMQNVWNSAEQR